MTWKPRPEIYYCKACNEEIDLDKQDLFEHWTTKHEGPKVTWDDSTDDQKVAYYWFNQENLSFIRFVDEEIVKI